jgi:hypothetical protein
VDGIRGDMTNRNREWDGECELLVQDQQGEDFTLGAIHGGGEIRSGDFIRVDHAALGQGQTFRVSERVWDVDFTNPERSIWLKLYLKSEDQGVKLYCECSEEERDRHPPDPDGDCGNCSRESIAGKR